MVNRRQHRVALTAAVALTVVVVAHTWPPLAGTTLGADIGDPASDRRSDEAESATSEPPPDAMMDWCPAVRSGPVLNADGWRRLLDEGFEEVFCVDTIASTPLVSSERALRQRHRPIGYSGVPRGVAEELAARIVHAEATGGRVYVHCHRGRHRAPAVVAAALVQLGRLNPSETSLRLRACGCDPRYPGLYASAARGGLTNAKEPDDVVERMRQWERLLRRWEETGDSGDAGLVITEGLLEWRRSNPNHGDRHRRDAAVDVSTALSHEKTDDPARWREVCSHCH